MSISTINTHPSYNKFIQEMQTNPIKVKTKGWAMYQLIYRVNYLDDDNIYELTKAHLSKLPLMGSASSSWQGFSAFNLIQAKRQISSQILLSLVKDLY